MSAGLTHLRPARVSDCKTILEFIRSLAGYEKLLDEVVATEEALQATLFGDRPYAEVVIAERAGEPVGFALFFHTFSTFLAKPGLYLEDLFVLPEARGHGVGRALICHLAKVAVDRDCGRIDWTVLDWNEPAIGFYQRLGATSLKGWSINRLSGDALRELARVLGRE